MTFTEAPSATFSGSNYIQYELKTGDGTGGISRRQTGLQSFLELEILLAFRANKNSGTILELRGQNDYAVLQVSITVGYVRGQQIVRNCINLCKF